MLTHPSRRHNSISKNSVEPAAPTQYTGAHLAIVETRPESKGIAHPHILAVYEGTASLNKIQCKIRHLDNHSVALIV